jgi:ABC-type uncharacterized transport system YnjBCD permease subunit
MTVEPFLSPADWSRAIALAVGFALGLGAFYVGMLWLGGGS